MLREQEIINEFLNNKRIPSRRELMQRYNITESTARDLRAIIKYLLQNNLQEPDINPVDIVHLPPAYECNNGKYKLTGYRRIAVLSDIHFPYHDNTALRTALKHVYTLEVDTIILNGDIVDFYSVSFWDRNPDKRNLQAERDLAIKGLDAIRKIFQDAEIIYKVGNHEERLERFLSKKVPELWQLEELRLENFLKLQDLGITLVNGEARIECGELDIIHGHEMRSWSSVNIAITYLRKAFKNVMFGHFHRSQADTKRDIRGELNGAWAVGCLCQLQQSYAPYNEWTHGFAFIELFDNGHFSVKNMLIQGGEVF